MWNFMYRQKRAENLRGKKGEERSFALISLSLPLSLSCVPHYTFYSFPGATSTRVNGDDGFSESEGGHDMTTTWDRWRKVHTCRLLPAHAITSGPRAMDTQVTSGKFLVYGEPGARREERPGEVGSRWGPPSIRETAFGTAVGQSLRLWEAEIDHGGGGDKLGRNCPPARLKAALPDHPFVSLVSSHCPVYARFDYYVSDCSQTNLSKNVWDYGIIENVETTSSEMSVNHFYVCLPPDGDPTGKLGPSNRPIDQ